MKTFTATVAALIGCLALASVPVHAQDGGTAKPLTVVELFTSQGCSSCPPADALLGELAGREDVLALSEHVDYWDYIGWKDPFAIASNTDRQRDYAAKFALRYVYTPQMVIDGTYQAVGSKRREVLGYLKKAAAHPRLGLSLRRTAQEIEVTLPAAKLSEPVRVLTVFFDKRHETSVKRGENSGRTLAYHNVVRRIQPLAEWRGEAATFKLPIDQATGEASAVILQSKRSLKVLGAARLDLGNS